MKTIIRREPDLLAEALNLFQKLAAGESMSVLKREIERGGWICPAWSATFSLVEEI